VADKNLVVRLLITAKDEASNVLSSMQGKVAAVAAAIAGYFGFTLLSGAVKGAGDFEAAMSRVKAATGAAGAELESLKKAAEGAGATTKYSSVEAAQALENLAKAGLSASQAVTALPAVLALAQAGDVSLAESASYVTRTVAGMGVAIGDAGRIADVLAQGANASNTSVKGLAEALSYSAPAARSLGLSMEQAVAYLGKFSDAGIDASRAGTALNAILSQFQDPTSKFRQELAAAGIVTGDFDKALRLLAKSGNSGEKAIIAVGTEAGPALRGLLNQGIGALDELKAKLDNAKGSALATAAVMGGNMNGALQGLESAWNALKNKLGEPVLPVITEALKDLTSGLQTAISNGTITKFGEAIKSAFVSAGEWVRKFADEVDFTALAARMQDFAVQTRAWFDTVAEKATNAGNIVSTAYGVMSSGVNVVMASVYKIAEVFSIVSASLLKDFSLIAAGLSKISFGGLSEGFKAAAADIRISAIGMVGVAAEFGRKSSEAFEGAATGAELARKGWASLTAPAAAATTKIEEIGKAATLTADQLDKAGEGATFVGGKLTELATKADASGKAQTEAAKKSAEAVAALRAEYAALLAAGKTDEAAKKLLEINAALRAANVTTAASSAAAAAATRELVAVLGEAVVVAERRVVVEKTAAGLVQSALQNDKYRAETILEIAKQRGNEKAIAEAQIAVWRIELQMNEALAEGARKEAEAMAIVTKAKRAELEASGSLTEAKKAELAVADASIKAKQLEAEKYDLIADRMKSLAYETKELKAEFGTLSEATDAAAASAERAAGSYDGLTRSVKSAAAARDGFVRDENGNVVQVAVTDQKYVSDRLQSMGVDKATSERSSRQFFDGNGNIQNTGGMSLEQAIQDLAARLQPKSPVSQGVSRTVKIDLTLNGRNTAFTAADQASADALVRALQVAAAGTS
jgi:TP901 family phage tail tape measure protein